MLFHIINKVGVKITRFLRNFFSSFQLTPENKAKQSGSSNSSELNKVRVLLREAPTSISVFYGTFRGYWLVRITFPLHA